MIRPAFANSYLMRTNPSHQARWRSRDAVRFDADIPVPSFEHVFHAEPLHTSAKHAFVSSMFFTLNRCTLQLNMP